MKEVDDTPVPESESVVLARMVRSMKREWLLLLSDKKVLNMRLEALEHRIATLEVRRVANENNQDDPEWY